MAGYLLVPNEKVPETFNAGFSMYVAAWPLLKPYPGSRFQTGLFGTWMFAQYDGPAPEKMYSDIEGGLGWWRDTRFADRDAEVHHGRGRLRTSSNGPTAPAPARAATGTSRRASTASRNSAPGCSGPPDGLNLKQGTCGELFGYGYLPLPLAAAKSTTAGKDVPTGDQCWTLFLNTGNFKGPVTFFTPYFWSNATVDEPHLAGMFLDTPPGRAEPGAADGDPVHPGRPGRRCEGRHLCPVRPTQFPRGPGDARRRSTASPRTTRRRCGNA